MAISINPDVSPRVITVLAPDTSITVQNLLNACRDWEDEHMEYPHLANASGKEDLGGGTSVGLTLSLQNTRLAFEARPGPEYVQCRVSGGNLVAVDTLGATINPIHPTAFTQVVTTSSSSATISDLSQDILNQMAAQLPLIEVASYNNGVTIDVVNGVAGTTFPAGTDQQPVNNLTDAQTIALARGFDNFFILGNLTLPSGANVTSHKFWGEGATLNVARTTVTLQSGCITTSAQWHDAKITGVQGGESRYSRCIIDQISNAHCVYEFCGLLTPTTQPYTIQQASSVSNGHASDLNNCFSDEGTIVIDRNSARLNQTWRDFSGRVKFINQNHATTSGVVYVHLNGGTITIDASCTKGAFFVSGTYDLVNESGGSVVYRDSLNAGVGALKFLGESARQTHQGFGQSWFVDPALGRDTNAGTAIDSAFLTVAAALSAAVSGRGDVIYLIAPSSGVVTITERVVVAKNDIHIRGPGRGLQFRPTTPNLGDVLTIDADNCSLSGFIVRAPVGSTTDNCITVNGKFSRMTKLYLVGTQAGSGNGFLYRGGDYHELQDCESEKHGGSGLKAVDALLPSGSPREITIWGGNWYLNNRDGIEFTGDPGNPTNSTRIMRLRNGVNCHDNTRYGLSMDTNTTKVVSDASTMLHSNTVANIYPADSGVEQTCVNEIVEDGLTVQQAMRLMTSALAGKISGAPSGPVVIRNVGDTKTRITATVDASGNRINVITDGT